MNVVLTVLMASLLGCGSSSAEQEPAQPSDSVPAISGDENPAEKLLASTNGDECATITNSIGMQFKLIPAGRFTMGSPPDEAGSEDDERQHEVVISEPYAIGVYEVTQAQYLKVMGRNPSWFQGDNIAIRHPKTNRVMEDVDSSHYPVDSVSWHDAVAFCNRLSSLPAEKAAGREYVLPTESQWEFACRAGSTTMYHGGTATESLALVGWYHSNSEEKTHPVGKKLPNAWGLYDTHGNVAEWCLDRYGEYPRNSSSDPNGPKEGSLLVGRGGSWGDKPESCRSAARQKYQGSYHRASMGFRIVQRSVDIVPLAAAATIGVRFMDIVASGQSFVYLIDTSSSMDGARLRVAQQQLNASLRMLKPEQQFAVIFYNEHRTRIKLRRQVERPMYAATPMNRMLAEQEVVRVTPDAGTDHKPALMEAISLQPDAIYFLTDGDEPRLSAADLRDIRQLAGKTSIHVIELSNGGNSSRTANWLEELAHQCRGEYRMLTVQDR